MRNVCPMDLDPCRSGCHDSELCARWGPYMIPSNPNLLVRHEFDMTIQPVLYTEGLDQIIQQKVEGYS